MIKVLFYEFLGAALMVYTFNFAASDYFARGFAYFIGWMFAVTISGAHFNPATSFAVYLFEGRYRDQLKVMLLFMLA